MATRLNTTCLVDNLLACVCFFPFLILPHYSLFIKWYCSSVKEVAALFSSCALLIVASNHLQASMKPILFSRQCDPKWGFHQELGSTAPAGMQTFSASGNEVYFACLLLGSKNHFWDHLQIYHHCPESPALQFLSELSRQQVQRWTPDWKRTWRRFGRSSLPW